MSQGELITARVFYSWQSDSPGNTNRNFISTVLEQAIDEVKNDDAIAVEPVIDRDTLGVAGSPDISDSIFSKIEESSVFVCDVSIIEPSASKMTPDPNVLVELDYAIKVFEWNRIIMIMNTFPTDNPKHFFEVVGRLHEPAGNTVKAHQELIRKASLKLGA